MQSTDEQIKNMTPEQSMRLFQGCLIILSGFALSIGMGFLLGQAGGWLTLAFLALVFAFSAAHVRRKNTESTDKTP